MKLDYPIYDADHHFYEPPEIVNNLPKSLKKHMYFAEINGRTKLVVNGRVSDYIPNPTFEVVAPPGAHEKWYRKQNPDGLSMRELVGDIGTSKPEYYNAEAHRAVLDQQGLAGAIVFPTLASAVERNLSYDEKVVYGIMRELNEWILGEYGFGANGRQFGSPVISLMDVDRAVTEIEWMIKEGVKVFTLRPCPVPLAKGDRSLAAKRLDPFWARVNEAGLIVGLHSSDTGYVKYFHDWRGGEGEYKPFEGEPLKEAMSLMGRAPHDALSSMICDGLFTRFPNIRVLSVENGSFWIPGLFEALDRTYGKMPQFFSEHPHETLRRHLFISPFYEDDADQLKDLMGASQVIFSSDWPHPEGLADPVKMVEEFANYSESEIKQVMSTNIKGLLDTANA